MKAIRVEQFGEPKVLKLAEVPDPQPNAGQVLIRVHAIGINPVETYIRSGSYPRKPSLPYTPGTDCAGVVERVGAEVTRFKPGDRVYTFGSVTGTYAELALCAENEVYPLPSRATFAHGAALGIPYATAYRALFQRGGLVGGEVVLVHGASGGVGTATVQLARAYGAHVLGTAGTDKGRDLVLAEGAHAVFDHRAPDYLDKLSAAAAPYGGVHLIVEMLANVNLAKDLTLLAMGGRVVVVGSRGTAEIDPRLTMGKDADIRGMILFATPAAALRQIHAALFAGLENGTLRPIIGREMPLADASKAHGAVMEPGAIGKIVLVP